MNHNVLELEGIEFAYPGRAPVLRGASLTVREGRKLALLGENGAGKTTLLLHLNGILRPKRGMVRLRGEKVSYGRVGLADWRRSVGMVLQNPEEQLFAATVYGDVSFGPLNLGLSTAEAAKRVEEALSSMRIADLRDRPTPLLSHGQKKRAAIAGVLAMRPDVLVLDEPTAGLDSATEKGLLAVLDRLSKTGVTLVMATHDTDLAWAWADEIALVSAGVVAVQDSREAVYGCGGFERVGVRPPLAPRLAGLLRDKGVLPACGPLPRTAEEIAALLAAPDEASAVRG